MCDLGHPLRGAAWTNDGTIIFASADPSTGLLTVPEGGGEPRVLTKPDPQKGENDHTTPSLLPNGKAVLFTIESFRERSVAVLDLATGAVKTLIRGGSSAEYAATGHIVFVLEGTLRAVRFDQDRLEVLGSPVPVLDRLVTKVSGVADFALSRDGTLVYVPGGPGRGRDEPPRSLVWVDRSGREGPIDAPIRAYNFARLSPDGTKVALDIRDQQSDIWIWDLARHNLVRLTDDPGIDTNPTWTPDGRRVAFTSNRDKQPGVYWQFADGTGRAEPLKSGVTQNARVFSRDGTRLVMGDTGVLNLVSTDGKSQVEELLRVQAAYNADISPDGKWLLYQSTESGRAEIHVRPFPNVNGGHWQISNSGGTKPVWARSGRELFYLDANNLLTVVPVETSAAFTFGKPVNVLKTMYYSQPNGRPFDVSPDGKRFLMIKDAPVSARAAGRPTVTVVLNWFEELKARVP